MPLSSKTLLSIEAIEKDFGKLISSETWRNNPENIKIISNYIQEFHPLTNEEINQLLAEYTEKEDALLEKLQKAGRALKRHDLTASRVSPTFLHDFKTLGEVEADLKIVDANSFWERLRGHGQLGLGVGLGFLGTKALFDVVCKFEYCPAILIGWLGPVEIALTCLGLAAVAIIYNEYYRRPAVINEIIAEMEKIFDGVNLVDFRKELNGIQIIRRAFETRLTENLNPRAGEVGRGRDDAVNGSRTLSATTFATPRITASRAANNIVTIHDIA